MLAMAMAGVAAMPHAVIAQGREAAAPPGQQAESATADPQAGQAIVPDSEFDAALPQLSSDIDAPLEPVDGFDASTSKAQIETLPPVSGVVPELAAPLTPLDGFDVAPPAEASAISDTSKTEVRYTTVLEGLDAIGLEDRFRNLSALENGNGKGGNAAMVSARAKEDEKLAVRVMQSAGYYDGTAVSSVEQNPANSGRLRAVVTANPGKLYHLGSVRVNAAPTVPPGLVERALPLKPGDPLEADRIQGAEANVSVRLPERGYPFVEIGQRDVLLDEATTTAAYTLPVTPGPRASFGGYTTAGKQAFDARHIGVIARFKRGELYDSRKVDDLRKALVATGLFATVSVEPQRTGEPGPDGTEYVNLHVQQRAGRPRTIAAEAGYSTGQGIRAEASWTHRNLFPPEGALILTAVGGTQEQGLTATFRRSNAGRRDHSFQAHVAADHTNYDAFEAYTGTLSARMSFDSTPIWQKRWTYYFGAELVGSNEDRYNYARGKRDRGTWLIAAVPTFLGYDTSDDLFNPTRGFRVKLNVSPETSVRGSARPYARAMIEGTAYYPVTDSIVLAGRARVGSIAGIGRDDLPPSRRYYGGGGGSVRGFGYQELGPRSPDGKPVGGRSFNEFAIEARYRFGNFGIVPFVDAGQVYETSYPRGSDIRFGAGIGGRFYTNFGPLRVDVATPIHRKPGESKVALYISIGQAF